MINNKRLHTFIAFLIIGVFYYFSQIKEGVRGKSNKKSKSNDKPTGVRNSKATTSRKDLIKTKVSSLLSKWQPF
jgi:Na+/H+ antiporter NhaC